MHIELCKEEIDNLSPSEKHVVLNSLHDVKKNSDLVDEYLTEASHGESDETEEDNDTDESGSEVETVNIDKWLCDEMQMANDAMDSINKKIAQAAKGEPVSCTLEELNSLKKAMLITTLCLATDSEFRHSFCRRIMPQALREIQKEIHKKVQENGRD